MGLFVGSQGYVLVDDLKIVPLSVSFGVQVIFQPKIVFHIIDFGDFAQVPVLESGVKDEDILLLWHMYLELGLVEVPLSLKSG